MTSPLAVSPRASRLPPLPRISGMLLHFTSLPGPGGCGDLGPEAHRFLEQLRRAGQRAWQVLPLGPTGYGDSPYQTASIFAGNPILVSPQGMVDEGLLRPADLAELPAASAHADYGAAQRVRFRLFELAAARLFGEGSELAAELRAALRRDFDSYCEAQSAWLSDYTLFAAIKEEQGMAAWISWPAPLRDRHPLALDEARDRLASRIRLHALVQWQFDRQFGRLRRAATAAGIELIGDVPIFVAHDSVEVWQQRDQFLLHPDGRLRVQAGVPPDYFSRTGQLWGNPLYDYARMIDDGFSFWRRRVARAAALFDRVRLDHFRGFAAHWEVPGEARTAEIGRWVPAPGALLFKTLLSDPDTEGVRYIAEDLGVITPDVEALRDGFGLPGIRVLQFGFGPDENYDGRPWGCLKNHVVYSSTHDNATLMGWYRGETDGTRGDDQAAAERARVHEYLGYEPHPEQAPEALLRLALGTAADTVIVPVQDVLGLGNEARMNRPGQSEGNWQFRLLPGQLDEPHLQRLRNLTRIYGRLPREKSV
ncbi:4-alpha-glucanotransferase [Haliangium sp. UPWRP_2]|uniref:4-alpha-glucanotransferase n=1 Tax=Haliangium sp. UPWRP_2 TaxID=1931276 RepID=UPI000B53BF04|nr:4-alpha-glucanotransferase [Haliangium sp. UPWRP_2]PSM31364.1 4-alpha-glucanotransferase [Haliangium sp. UPWRP_2]